LTTYPLLVHSTQRGWHNSKCWNWVLYLHRKIIFRFSGRWQTRVDRDGESVEKWVQCPDLHS